jgi:hypothetical protein
VTKSHSRPQVSNDNPFSESQFKTMKYWPEFPDRFDGFEHAHGFCGQFFSWYNDEHYHSGIGLLTPAMLHYGAAERVRDKRQRARARRTRRIRSVSCRACHRRRRCRRRCGSTRQSTSTMTTKKGFQRRTVPTSPMRL